MKRLLQLILVLGFIGLGLFFGALNEARVTVDYFFFRLDWPLALSLATFFFAGALIGGLVTYLGNWLTVRRRVRQVRRQARADAKATSRPALPRSSESND